MVQDLDKAKKTLRRVQAQLRERDEEIEVWRDLYIQLRDKLKKAVLDKEDGLSEALALADKYDVVPDRITFTASGKTIRKVRKLKKKKEGARS